MKNFLKAIVYSAPMRWALPVWLRVARVIGGVGGQLKLKALVPLAGDSICHWSVEIDYPHNVTLGRRVIIGPNSRIGAGAPVYLGDHVRISPGAIIETGGLDFTGEPPYPHKYRPIRVEEGVWLGMNVMVLGGVTIGKGSIIGAGVVVRRNIPPFSLVSGVGAEIKPRTDAYALQNRPALDVSK